MKDMLILVQSMIAMIAGFFGWFLGGCDGLVLTLIACVIADYITGVMCGISDKALSSEIGFRGICRKIIIFTLVGLANILDVYIIKTGCAMRTAVLVFYISNEGISLIENAGHLGLPIPQKLRDVLEQLDDDSGGDAT